LHRVPDLRSLNTAAAPCRTMHALTSKNGEDGDQNNQQKRPANHFAILMVFHDGENEMGVTVFIAVAVLAAAVVVLAGVVALVYFLTRDKSRRPDDDD
jgi:hypothetical protein